MQISGMMNAALKIGLPLRSYGLLLVCVWTPCSFLHTCTTKVFSVTIYSMSLSVKQVSASIPLSQDLALLQVDNPTSPFSVVYEVPSSVQASLGSTTRMASRASSGSELMSSELISSFSRSSSASE